MFTCSCTTNHLTLFPSQLLDLGCFSLHMYTIHLKHSYSLYSLYFLSMYRLTFIYNIFIVKICQYRFIVFFFTSLLYVCIYVAPWSCEARRFVPLYVPTCVGMTIKLKLTYLKMSAKALCTVTTVFLVVLIFIQYCKSPRFQASK